MVHHRERLAFGFESRQHRLGIHARLDQFHGHLASNRFGLLGDPNGAHAAFADFLQQLVAAGNDGSELLDGRTLGSGVVRLIRRGSVEQMVGAIVGLQQRIDAGAQGRVAGARLVQVCGPFGGGQSHGRGKNGLNAIGGFGHGMILVG